MHVNVFRAYCFRHDMTPQRIQALIDLSESSGEPLDKLAARATRQDIHYVEQWSEAWLSRFQLTKEEL